MTKIENPVDSLVELLKDDGTRHGWVCNIAMCFFDQMMPLIEEKNAAYGDIHLYQNEVRDVANLAADNFLKILERGIK